jgi:hypothetical protein
METEFDTPEALFALGYIMSSQAIADSSDANGMDAPIRFPFGPYSASFYVHGSVDRSLPLAFHDLVFEIDFGGKTIRALRRHTDLSRTSREFLWLDAPTDSEIIAMKLLTV